MATILRLPEVQAKTGKGRSATYADIDRGVMVKPIKLGERAVGFPDYEVDAIIKARIAGASEMELRTLVDKLHAQRKEGLQ
ncbi:MAG: AlpA family phage regulatory protein [Burkholderiales bacterium]|uniref:helix-turn-helix transcriptional regulator n=1 Tax=Roseateles sp. TaxID=1971397 RepID=UPI000FABE1D4|nr:MAG: AlpA family phage regulatory protein [Burkholderiales bacterium]